MKAIYLLIVLISLTLLAGYGVSYFNKPAVIPPAVRIEEPSIPEATGRCESQFREYVTESFSICYPAELQPLASDSAHSVITFSSEDEELRAGYDPEKKWQIHLCNFEKQVTVASQSATRTTFNQDSTAGCGRPYRFVTMVTHNDALFSIDLRKRDGTYVDTIRYDTIEQSLQLPQAD